MSRLYLLLFITLIYSVPVNGQKFSVGAGAGLGKIINETADGTAIKGLIFLQGAYHLNSKLSLGLEIGTAGNLSPIEDNNVVIDDIIILSPFDTKATMILVKPQYYFTKDGIWPYASLGFGVNTYFSYLHVGDTDKVSKTNFAAMPEVGVKLYGLSMSAKYLFGGKSPTFEGVDDSGDSYRLASETISILYFTLGYTLDF